MCCNLPAVGQSLGRAWIVLSLWGVHSNPFQRSPLSGRPFYGADQYGIEAGQTGKHIARAWQSSPVWYYIGSMTVHTGQNSTMKIFGISEDF
jgi:hypothetical protein